MNKQTNVNGAGFYKGFFKGWNKALGSKPSDELLATIHALGARPGKQALANAMMLRPEGATASQIVLACGAPQLNKMRELVARKLVTRDMNVAPSEAGHTVYKIVLAAKGKLAVDKAAAAPAEPDTAKPAKAKRKAKAKAVKVTEPVTPEPAPQAEPVTEPAQ